MKTSYAVTNLYVANLSPETTQEHLKTLFETFGRVERVTLVTDRETGASQGFAFVEMANSFEAHSARELLSGTEVHHREIQISEARPLAVVMGRM